MAISGDRADRSARSAREREAGSKVMLQPKQNQIPQDAQGPQRRPGWSANAVSFGEYGLKRDRDRPVDARQIEAARRSISRYVKRGGKMWIRVFPRQADHPEADRSPHGFGQGNVEYWVAQIQPGRMIYEIEASSEATARGVPAWPPKLSVTTNS